MKNILLAAGVVLALASSAHADISDSGNGVIGGTVTVQGDAFSVGGSTFTVAYGSASVGGQVTCATCTLQVVGSQSVTGNIESDKGFSAGGTGGVTATCTGTQVFEAQTTVGGIVTGGTCAAQSGGGGGSGGLTSTTITAISTTVTSCNINIVANAASTMTITISTFGAAMAVGCDFQGENISTSAVKFVVAPALIQFSQGYSTNSTLPTIAPGDSWWLRWTVANATMTMMPSNDPAVTSGCLPQTIAYNTAGTYTFNPAGCGYAVVTLIGGGGEGSPCPSAGGGEGAAGGGSGAYVNGEWAVSPSASITVVVASATAQSGTSCTLSSPVGHNGGTTSFGSYASASGGLGGQDHAGGSGGTPSTNGAGISVNTQSGATGGNTSSPLCNGGAGGAGSGFGGANGPNCAGNTGATGGAAGTNGAQGGQGGTYNSTAAASGGSPGAGGGGGDAGGHGQGVGAAGEVIIVTKATQ